MPLPYIDSNILIRFITRDHPHQSALAKNILEQMEKGEVVATTCEAVILEVVQVLSSKSLYSLPRRDISTFLTGFINLKGLKIAHKNVYLKALNIYAQNKIDFTDCLLVAYMQRDGVNNIFSFDTDFDKIKGITKLP